jgi:uncharacterized membrane protein HdeD (DUF308 family)
VTAIEAEDGTVDFDPSRLWWIWLVVGIAWLVSSLVILQFEQASVTTVSLIIGIMFLAAGTQQIALAVIADELRWVWVVLGALYLAAGAVCLANPEETFHAFADVLGFLFLVVGVGWTIRAFLTREADSLWWLGLLGGFLLMLMAFETSGQLFIEKTYTLLVFAGLWAFIQGVLDIVRAFQVRAIHRPL